MAVVRKVTKLANPHRRRTRRAVARLANRTHKRRRVANKAHRKRTNPRKKMTAKQIKHFGTKRQRAALKASRTRKRTRLTTRKAKANPRRRRRTNPAPLMVTLGPALNPRKPRKRRTTVAKAKANRRRRATNSAPRHRRRRVAVARRNHRPRTRVNPRRANTRRRRRNPSRVVVVTRRSNRRRRRNPDVLGVSLTSKSGMMLISGTVAGVAGAKFLPTVLPTAMLGSLASSNAGKTMVTGASAFICGFLATRWNRDFGAGVYIGGLAQTVSVFLNAFLPSFYSAIGSPLSGMGDFVPARFAVPQNPLSFQRQQQMRQLQPAPPTTPAMPGQVPMSQGALSSAYGPAY